MRKGRQRARHNGPTGKDADNSTDEGAAATEPHSDAAEKSVDVTADDGASDQPVDVSATLESLSRELAQSIGGEDLTPISEAAPAPPPPARNATPEDILGLQSPAFAAMDEPEATKTSADPPDAGTVAGEGGGSKPMEEFEERAAMANEVLRATSDKPRSSRKRKEREGADSAADENEGEDADEAREEHVRFSEDVTISANRRSRRKLFGR